MGELGRASRRVVLHSNFDSARFAVKPMTSFHSSGQSTPPQPPQAAPVPPPAQPAAQSNTQQSSAPSQDQSQQQTTSASTPTTDLDTGQQSALDQSGATEGDLANDGGSSSGAGNGS